MDANSAQISGIVVFHMAEQAFGLPVHLVREVVPMAWLDRPPGLSSLVEGVLNLGGQAVPVLRLDRLLGLEARGHGLESSILIMKASAGESPLGLLVEHLDGVRQIGDFSPMGLPAGQSFNGCLAEIMTCDGQPVSMLDWGCILLEQEKERLAQFQARAQERLAGLPDFEP
jgi:purine-binding chemotaxis protein CheW